MVASLSGRTLEEARKLVEQSFGNYVGSNVMVAAKEELTKIHHEIELLSLEVGDEAVDRKCLQLLSEEEYNEISNLQEELRVNASGYSCLFDEILFSIHFSNRTLSSDLDFFINCLWFIDQSYDSHQI